MNGFRLALVLLCLVCPLSAGAVDAPQPASAQARDLIARLQLTPLPEVPGAYFRETYRSSAKAAAADRACATSILYLLTGSLVDPWHRVASDELFDYLGGATLRLLLLKPDGTWEERRLGLERDAEPQVMVPAGTWMAMTLAEQGAENWGLYSVWVVPGFDYADYATARSKDLAPRWPEAAARMREMRIP